MLVFALDTATVFGAAAAFSSIAGVILAVLSHRMGKKSADAKAAAETHAALLAARKEAEELSAELHRLKMEQSHDPSKLPE